jgi:hydrogenase nickel incorporation protein HypA/HybF
MHELAIAAEIVRQAVEVAAKHNAERIDEVEVQIGVMRQIVPDALQMGFTACAEGTLARNARLAVIEEKVVAVCKGCECLFLPEIDNFLCPRCGQAEARIVAGNDIILKSIVCHAVEEATLP